MRIVVLVSGTGSNLQAVIDAVRPAGSTSRSPPSARTGPEPTGWSAPPPPGIPTFVVDFKAYPDRAAWNAALTEAVAAYRPDVVVSSGFMRIVSAGFIEAFGGKYLNTHPALLPSFPGAHGVRDALAYGVKVTGCTVHWADAGVEPARSSRRKPWRWRTAKPRTPCTSGSRPWSAGCWCRRWSPSPQPSTRPNPPDFPVALSLVVVLER